MTVAQLELPFSFDRGGVDQMAELLAADAHELTAKLAYEFWEQRGRPFGSPEVDWFSAEEALAPAQRDPNLDLPLYGISLEANEGPFATGGAANQRSSN
jgi:hypothetical protein